MNKKTVITLSLALLVSFTACMRKHTDASRAHGIVFPSVGHWKVEGKDTKEWTGNLVIKRVDGKEFAGYFDWYYAPGAEYVGKEEFNGVYDAKSKKVVMTGYDITNKDKLALGTYQAYLAKNGLDFVSGIWGGEGTPPDFGFWEAKFQNAEAPPDVDGYLMRAYDHIYEDYEFDEAIKEASEAIRLAVLDADNAMKAYFLRATAYIGKKEYDKAVKDFSAALKIIPDHRIYFARAMVYAQQDKYDQVIKDITEAIRIEAEPGMYLERARAHIIKEDYHKAIEDAAAEIRLFQDDHDGDIISDAYRLRADAYAEIGEYDKAIEDYTTGIPIDPENPGLYNGRAWTYAHYLKKEFDRAVEDANMAIELKPEEGNYYDTRGWAYFGKGDYERAAADFTRALELRPGLKESEEGLQKVQEAQAAQQAAQQPAAPAKAPAKKK